MSYFFHPLNQDIDYRGFSNSSNLHTVGNLDYGNVTEDTVLYAMCDGEIAFQGRSGETNPATGEKNTFCCIKCSKNQLNETFYIRYLHGDYTVETGQTVKRGDPIGTVGNHGWSSGPHLHIDFAWGGGDGTSPTKRDPPVAGTLEKRSDSTYFKYKNPVTNTQKEVKVDTSIIDLDQINIWKNQTTVPSELGDIGYCWLVFAQNPEHLDPGGPEGGIPIDRTVYDNNDHWSGDNSDGVTAYYTRTIKDSFLGPMPETWDIYESDACRGFRVSVAIVMHEIAGFGPFISQVWAKVLRAIIIGYSGLHHNADNLDDWLHLAMDGWPDWVWNYERNNPDCNWCSKQNLINNFGDEALPFLKAYYSNLKYPNIYGSELSSKTTSTQPHALENLIAAAYKAMNGACVGANGYWSLIQGAKFVVNWDPDTGTDRGAVPDDTPYPPGSGNDHYEGHMVAMRGTSGNGGGTIDRCYTEYLE